MSCIPWLVVLGASGVDGPISFLGMNGYVWVMFHVFMHLCKHVSMYLCIYCTIASLNVYI